MKIFKVLLVVAIALGMMACNNEQDVPEISGEKDATISIKVYPSSQSAGVRAIGDLSGNGILTPGIAAESKIHKLEAWVFLETGALETYKSATIADGGVTEIIDIVVTSGPRTVVVTANTNIGSQPTLTALEGAQYTLSQDISAGLPMTAESFDVDLVAGNNYYGYSQTEVEGKTVTTGNDSGHKELLGTSPVALTRVNARVAIVDAKLELPTLEPGEEQLFNALEEIEVAMFNVPQKSKMFGNPLALDADFLIGEAWPSTAESYISTGTAVADLKEGSLTLPIASEAAPYFYVTENQASVTKGEMFIVLRGKPMKDTTPVVAEGFYTDADGYTYYPVWVNLDGVVSGDSKVVRNTQYNIFLTISGIGNPTIDPVENAWLDVKVEVASWNVVTQEVTWE